MNTPPPPSTAGLYPWRATLPWAITVLLMALQALYIPARAATFEAGLIAFDRGAHAEAVALWEKAAAAGSALAAYNLGVMHEAGQGIPRDAAAAAKWFRMAAMRGQADAMMAIARMHETGTGVAKNLAEARFWYERVLLLKPEGADTKALMAQARERMSALKGQRPTEVTFDGGRFLFVESLAGRCVIALQGRVTRDTTRKFHRVVEMASTSGCQDPFILLESPGGSLADGIELGRDIHLSGYSTIVRRACASACALMFLGGKERRLMGSRARVGLHQSSVSREDSDEKICVSDRLSDASRRKRQYLIMVVPDHAARIFDVSLATPCTAMYWVHGVEALEMGVATSVD